VDDIVFCAVWGMSKYWVIHCHMSLRYFLVTMKCVNFGALADHVIRLVIENVVYFFG
jgi:hypothetical protein